MQNDGSISPARAFFRHKWVRFFLALDAVAIVAVIGVVIWNATKTAIINFNIAPLDANIQLGVMGGGYHNGSYRVHPGTYDVTISRDGLAPKTFTLDLKSGYSTDLTTFLSGEDGDLEFYELKDNYTSFQELASIASANDNQTTDHDTSAEQFISNFQENYTLWQDALPITYTDYEDAGDGRMRLGSNINIQASSSDSCWKLLCIDASAIGESQNYVNQLLVDNGFNLEDYEIHYEIIDQERSQP